jgi:hypothetical protein
VFHTPIHFVQQLESKELNLCYTHSFAIQKNTNVKRIAFMKKPLFARILSVQQPSAGTAALNLDMELLQPVRKAEDEDIHFQVYMKGKPEGRPGLWVSSKEIC